MDPALLKAITDYGVVAGLCVFLVWQTVLREKRLSVRVDGLESYVRSTLAKTLAAHAKALVANTAVLERVERILEKETATDT